MPSQTGLATKLIQFFRDNPDEELSYKDIAQKFSATDSAVKTAVYWLRKCDKLECAYVIRAKAKGTAT